MKFDRFPAIVDIDKVFDITVGCEDCLYFFDSGVRNAAYFPPYLDHVSYGGCDCESLASTTDYQNNPTFINHYHSAPQRRTLYCYDVPFVSVPPA